MSTSTTAFALLATTIAALAAEPAGSVKGRVLLRGEPPPEREIRLDIESARLHATPPKTRFYTVGKDGGLGDVFVYVRDEVPGVFVVPQLAAATQILGSLYQPQIVALQTGQRLQIINSDELMHNVHVSALKNPEKNIAELAHKLSASHVFAKRELFIRLKCDVHPWEFGYVCVMEHPFFALTGADGKFKLPPGLPDGQYTLEAAHRKAGTLTREITVKNGTAPPVEFIFDVKPVK